MFTRDGCRIEHNSALTGSGGGIYNAGDYIQDGSTIVNNVAMKIGGGICNCGKFSTNRSGDVSKNSALPPDGVGDIKF